MFLLLVSLEIRDRELIYDIYRIISGISLAGHKNITFLLWWKLQPRTHLFVYFNTQIQQNLGNERSDVGNTEWSFGSHWMMVILMWATLNGHS